MSDAIQTKQCSKCKEIKLTSDFYKDKNHKDGLCSLCKQCHLQICKQYYQAHRAKYQQFRKQYYKTIRGHLRYIWHGILQRCNNPKFKRYEDWGGRGIQVKFGCFEDFHDYVIEELKADPRGLTIDRIDNDGNYERGNIRFVTQAENNRNR